MDQTFGITELYRPPCTPVVDIVAIHGLTGDALKTWTSEDGKTCWLSHQEFLPKYVKNARILTYGYNANVLSLNGKRTSADRILQHAQTLVSHLTANRALEGLNEVPIIFVCHSLGGIVVKRAISYSESRIGPKISHLHSIYTCTYAILFLGTPHSGSSKAHLARSVQKLTALAIPTKLLQTESNLLRTLEEDSEVLQDINDHFEPLRKGLRIFFFWEQERTDLKGKKDYIVDETSAAPILDDTERCGIAADHSHMCKFRSNKDHGFQVVVEALRRYTSEAPHEIQTRLDRRINELETRKRHEAEDLLNSFKPSHARG